MQAIENKIINRIYGKGRGWVFFQNDFSDLGSVSAIDQSFTRLVKKQKIRRVMRGIYEYPKYSKLLDKTLAPEIDNIAHALARKFGWTIQVSGNTALNVLGLSTQMPSKYIYMSDGKTKTYEVGKQTLLFKKAPLKDMGLKYAESALLVQAIKALNKKSLDEKERQVISNYFDESIKKKVLKDTQYTTSWVYEEIKQVFKDE